MIALTIPRLSSPAPTSSPPSRDVGGLPEFLCRTPPLTAVQECRLFQKLRDARSLTDTPRHRRRRERLRNQIVAANLRLLVSIAVKFTSPQRTLADAVSDGFAPLIRATELFDPARGNRFSTYASHAIWNHLARIGKRDASRRSRESAMSPGMLAAAASSNPVCDGGDAAKEQLARHPEEMLRHVLTEREIYLLAARFGLGEFPREHTFREIATMVDLSRERVRVLTHRALQKLREHLQIDGGCAAG